MPDPADRQMGQGIANTCRTSKFTGMVGCWKTSFMNQIKSGGKIPRVKSRFISAHAKAHHIGMRVCNNLTGNLQRLLCAKMTDAGYNNPPFNPKIPLCILYSGGYAVQVIPVADTGRSGMIRRRKSLNIQRFFFGAAP